MSEYREAYDRLSKRANEAFKGANLDNEKYDKYQKIQELAKQLSAKRERFWSIDHGCVEPSADHRHAGVFLDFTPPMRVTDEKEAAIATMAQTADDMIFAVKENGQIRMSFVVRNVWSE